MPLISLSACKDDKEYKPVASFEFLEPKYDVTRSDDAYFYGFCKRTSDKQVTLIDQLCHVINFTLDLQPYDSSKVDVTTSLNDWEEPLTQALEVEIEHTGDRFPTGTYRFDLVLVWYENDDYHHLFEKTITGFGIQSNP